MGDKLGDKLAVGGALEVDVRAFVEVNWPRLDELPAYDWHLEAVRRYMERGGRLRVGARDYLWPEGLGGRGNTTAAPCDGRGGDNQEKPPLDTVSAE